MATLAQEGFDYASMKLLSRELLFGPPFQEGKPETMGDLERDQLPWGRNVSDYGWAWSFSGRSGGYRRANRDIDLTREEGRSEQEKRVTGCYYVRDEGLFYVYAYSRDQRGRWSDRTYLGAVGVSGFAPAGGAPPERFPRGLVHTTSVGAGGILLTFPDRVFLYGAGSYTDLPRLLYGGERGKVAGLVVGDTPEALGSDGVPWVAVLTEQGIVRAETGGADPAFVEHPPEIAFLQHRLVRVSYPAETGGFFARYHGCFACGWSGAPGHAAYFEPGKGRVASFELSRQEMDQDEAAGLYREFRPVAGGFSPPLAAALGRSRRGEWGLPFGFWSCPVCATEQSGGRGLVHLPVAAGLGALSLVLSLWFGRRHAFGTGALAGWGGVCAVFGLAGFFTMLAVCDWPARVSCKGCGQWRVVTRERCGQCGAPFPPPEPDGTEIFEAVPESGQKS